MGSIFKSVLMSELMLMEWGLVVFFIAGYTLDCGKYSELLKGYLKNTP